MSYGFLFIAILLLLAATCYADNRTTEDVDLILEPAKEAIVVGAIVDMQSSGMVDLSSLLFTVSEESIAVENSLVDIVLVGAEEGHDYRSPQSWFDVGVGKSIGKGGFNKDTWHACCTTEAHEGGLCEHEDLGRLIIDPRKFLGRRIDLAIPPLGDYEFGIDIKFYDPLLIVEQRGKYILAFSNCHEDGRVVTVSGSTEWTSYITDKEIEQTAPFFALLTVIYFGLLTWFGFLMTKHSASRIRVEEWIWFTILFTFIDTATLTITAYTESRHIMWLTVVSMFISSSRVAMTHCLLLFLVMGWGVVRAHLEIKTMMTVLVLGIAVLALDFLEGLQDLEGPEAVEEETFQGPDSDEQDNDNFAFLLSVATSTFWIWTLYALISTIQELKDERQIRKLKRFQCLLIIMILTITFNLIVTAFIVLQLVADLDVDLAILPEIDALGFCVTLSAIAWLWKPNHNARAYAYVLELTGDDDDDLNDLELTENSGAIMTPTSEEEDDSKTSRPERVIT
mmetsp:Transcript_27974/g.42346  ORF Transcript_27974/g.42346 Transcript_27974/m.42346 type:complete len:509 (-) Transcript_27974:85-1611(-)|eukprot:CAMPEP_0178901296 /NCGR_PEP_ID=MMETSP0786-20121207/3942_1 /TAXON_ID=186022 /ORGANISM="Thalassionema frauenfeldii, Strain CCMP 1798" /LENGTH=508 /DNA_ID=CAMNT_0020572379 /DNA_START=41 /DNA_END=1567 /DNA_ORIENTATION=-